MPDQLWSARPFPPELRAGEPHLWLVDLRTAPAVPVLNADERHRADRMKIPALRNRWIAARSGLRRILSSYVGVHPSSVDFETGRWGKPVLVGMPGRELLEFNLSHSNEIAVVAVALEPVGVDVEQTRPLSDIDDVVHRFFSPEEESGLTSLDADERLAAFYRLWTRKEALIKAAGYGLEISLADVIVDWLDTPRPAILAVPDRMRPLEQWHLASVATMPGFSAALASSGALRAMHRFRWQDTESADASSAGEKP